MDKKKIGILGGLVAFLVAASVSVYFLADSENDNTPKQETVTEDNTASNDNSTGEQQVGAIEVTYTKRDLDDSIDGASIEFSDDEIKTSAQGVKVTDNTVTIMAGGNYVLSGKSSNAKVVISAGKNADIHIILNNADIACEDDAVFNETDGAKVVYTLAKGSKNVLADNREVAADTSTTTDATDTTASACISSKGDITVNGTGALTIVGNHKNGIKSSDNIKIVSGDIDVTASNNAIAGNDCVIIDTASVKINSQGDGIKTKSEDVNKGFIVIQNGKLDITCNDDGISATRDIEINGGDIEINANDKGMNSDLNLVINGGDIKVAKSNEGIQARYLVINDGDIDIISSDDALNATEGSDDTANQVTGRRPMNMSGTECSLTINGGKITIDSSGDGIDSNGNIYINGGETYVNGPTNNGNAAIDYGEGNSKLVVNDGIFVAVGSSGMAVFPSEESKIYSLAMTPGMQKDGTIILVTDSAGEEILKFDAKKSFSSVIISSNKIKKDESYTVKFNDEEYTTLTVSDIVTCDEKTDVNAGNNMFGGGKGGFGNKGERPQMPEGGRPQMPEGGRPQLPEGEMPQIPEETIP